MYDTLIVGSGPAGLAVANTLQKDGLSVLVVEKGAIADHIARYPTFMRFFSTRELLEIDGFPLNIVDEKPSRQQYLNYLARFVQDRRIEVRTYTEARHIERAADGSFRVVLRQRDGGSVDVSARYVVMAVGAWEHPRTLNVPGEDLPKVTHHFTEPHNYIGTKVLVVGGRNSAVETALTLFRSGVETSLSYRRDGFDGHGLKYWLKPDIENRIKKGEIAGYLGTTVKRIDWNSVTLQDKHGNEIVVDNDFVVCETGYEPPAGFLREAGIKVQEGTNLPNHDPETLESNVPGLFIAGTIIAGNVSGHVFIENSRTHGEQILKGIRAKKVSVAAAKG